MAGNLGRQKCFPFRQIYVGELHEATAGNHCSPLVFHVVAALPCRLGVFNYDSAPWLPRAYRIAGLGVRGNGVEVVAVRSPACKRSTRTGTHHAGQSPDEVLIQVRRYSHRHGGSLVVHVSDDDLQRRQSPPDLTFAFPLRIMGPP